MCNSGRQLVAVRHTAVDVRPGLCYGQIEMPLADSFPRDLLQVQKNLPELPYARIISSPLQRCYQLALHLQRGSVTRDSRLLELSFGQWEGLPWSEIPRDLSEYWTDDVIHRAPPDGESFRNLIARAEDLLADPMLWSQGDCLLFVTHAGVLRALEHILGGQDLHDCLRLSIDLGSARLWRL